MRRPTCKSSQRGLRTNQKIKLKNGLSTPDKPFCLKKTYTYHKNNVKINRLQKLQIDFCKILRFDKLVLLLYNNKVVSVNSTNNSGELWKNLSF